MAPVIKSFLVGVGLDAKDFDKGSKEVTDNLGRIRSLAGIAGAALVGAFAAAASQAIAAGQRIDKFTLSTERMSASTGFVYNFGNALRLMGGNADEAVSAITSFEAVLDQLKQGNYNLTDLNVAGIDTSALTKAGDGVEFTRVLAEMVPTLDKTQQRILQENLGISDATMRSLRLGKEQFDALLSRAGQLTGDIRGSTEAAREFNKQIAELQLRFEGVGNTLADKMLPSMNGILDGLGKFIDANDSKVKAGIDTIADSPIAAATLLGGSAAAVAGTTLSTIGLKGLGSGLSRFGTYGMALGAGALAWDLKPNDIEGMTGYRPPEYIFENTPADAARDAYNWGAGKIGLDPIEKPKQPWEQDARDQLSGFEDDIRKKLRERMGEGAVSGVDAYPQVSNVRPYAERSAPLPKIKNDIALIIELDGRALEHKVTDVLARRGQATIDDIQSTTVR